MYLRAAHLLSAEATLHVEPNCPIGKWPPQLALRRTLTNLWPVDSDYSIFQPVQTSGRQNLPSASERAHPVTLEIQNLAISTN